MRDSELRPDRRVFVHGCAICDQDITRQDPIVWISARYKNSDAIAASAHAHCVRSFLPERSKSLLDPDKVASDADISDE